MISVAWSHCFSGGLELSGRGGYEVPIRLALDFEAVSVFALLRRPTVFVEGTCDVTDVIGAVPVRGTVGLERGPSRAPLVRYTLRFDHNAAGFVRAEGTQTFDDRHLYAALTVIHLTLLDTAGAVARGRLRVDARSGLRSFTRGLRAGRAR